jgi:ribonuclease HI
MSATLTLPRDSIAELESLATTLSLPPSDLLLIGDGSGTTYAQPGGWACVAYDRQTGKVRLHAGALSGATNNFAELAPYVQALWHHHQEHGQDPATPVRVQIVSDSELTVRCGQGQYARRANACLWAAIGWFEDNGYVLGWRHVPRNSNVWSSLCDHVAGLARTAFSEFGRHHLSCNSTVHR